MQSYAFGVLAVAYVIWFGAFVFRRKKTGKAQRVEPRARWGMLLEGAAFALVLAPPFWERNVAGWRYVLAVLFLVAACVLSWTGVRALGRQWRLDAGLNTDHELVRSGPYALVRHPIYTSMLAMLLGAGFMMARWGWFALAIAVFLAGTEIRVRIEDGLLESRFGADFERYRAKVPAYIPGTRQLSRSR